jgi:prepilin-type N-terminal cleavage/methylation domain-containing protein
MHLLRPKTLSPSGYSLVELLVAIAILAILSGLSVVGLKHYTQRSQDIVCMSNLRGLHAAFASYLNENGQRWPQNPQLQKDDFDDNKEVKFWVDTLQPYGPNRQTWLCPADKQGTAKDTDEKEYIISYYPTPFDEEPGSAYKWINQPWLIENGGLHGKGENNVVFPDGRIEKRPYGF